MFKKQGDSSTNPHPTDSDSDSDSQRAPSERPKPVLANATYLLSNTKALMNKQVVSIHPDHIPTDYSAAEADRAAKVANNLRLDMNMYYEEHLQRELENHEPFVADAQKAVELIHDKIDFASLEMTGARVAQADLREEQIQHLTNSLKDSYPPGKLEEFVKEGDWSDNKFKALLGTYTGPEGRPRQATEASMKVLKQIKTQLPYFGGSIEYQQNQKNSLEYYVYHISTLTRDANQQYGIGSEQGNVLPKDLKNYNTRAEGEVPFLNLRNLGTGVVESEFHKLPYTLQHQITKTLDRVRTSPDQQSKQARALRDFEAKLGQQEQPPSAAQIWDQSNEDEKKHLFANILRLPWSDAHLHGGEGYEQVTSPSDLQPARSTERIQETLPPRSNERAGLMNVAGVTANVLEKPDVASKQYAEDNKFRHLQTLKEQGTLQTLFPGAVPGAEQTLQQEFETKHQTWHDRAMLHAKPQIGGISGHTLGYMNLYAQALDQVPAEQRDQYPTPERLRTIMLAGLIGTKRHHSYDEVMSASTGTGKGSVPAEGYNAPSSYADVLDSADPEIRGCARTALDKAKARYMQESHTVLKTITKSLKTLFPDDARDKTEKLNNAVGEYLQGLGRNPDSAKLSSAVTLSMKGKPPLPSVSQRVANMERQQREGRDPGRRIW